MPEMTSYKHGTPSWVDLSTTDMEGAKVFYGELLGWAPGPEGSPEAGGYTMFLLGGKNVAAVMPQRPEQAGMPPVWTTYIAVDDADEIAAKAKNAGGNVMGEPFDVFEAGRMAIVFDPTGAAFGIWQAKEHIGAQVVNEPGALVWNELDTRDVDAATDFYGEVLGWQISELDGPVAYYQLKRDDGELIGGMMPMPEQVPAEVPSYWLTYFAVEDCDATVAKATELGGSVAVPPTDIPAGRFSVLHDPQGGTFAAIKMTR